MRKRKIESVIKSIKHDKHFSSTKEDGKDIKWCLEYLERSYYPWFKNEYPILRQRFIQVLEKIKKSKQTYITFARRLNNFSVLEIEFSKELDVNECRKIATVIDGFLRCPENLEHLDDMLIMTLEPNFNCSILTHQEPMFSFHYSTLLSKSPDWKKNSYFECIKWLNSFYFYTHIQVQYCSSNEIYFIEEYTGTQWQVEPFCLPRQVLKNEEKIGSTIERTIPILFSKNLSRDLIDLIIFYYMPVPFNNVSNGMTRSQHFLLYLEMFEKSVID